LIHFPSIK